MERKKNKNLQALITWHSKQKHGISLEGGSRSGKTWSVIFFLIYLAALGVDHVVVIRETYNSFKTTLYEDFRRILNSLKIDNPFHNKEVSMFYIFDMKVQLVGADKFTKYQGLGADVFWFNEVLNIDQKVFLEATKRCRMYWIADFNPYQTISWYFRRTDNDDNVIKVHSTMLDNPHISENEKRTIMGFEPTPENIRNGTADEYQWNVYGLGKRTAPEGLIFKHVTWIDEFPDDIGYWYGLDFGYTQDPTAIVKVGTDSRNIYSKLLIYKPIDTPAEVSAVLEAIGVQRSDVIVADSADRYGTVNFIQDLQLLGWNIVPVRKNQSVMFWLNKMKERRLNFVTNQHFMNEVSGYTFKTINGITINQPIDGNDHAISATRYAVMSEMQPKEIFV